MIRHKKSRIYRVKDSTCTVSEFRKSLSVSVNEVTEDSRPTKHASAFSKVFTRCEVAVKAGLPTTWSNRESLEQLLRDIWAFGFAFASYVRLEFYKDGVLMSDRVLQK